MTLEPELEPKLVNLDQLSTAEFIQALNQLGIQLSVKDGNLAVKAPKGVVTPSIKAQLTQQKPKIIEWINQQTPLKQHSQSIAPANRSETQFISVSQQSLWRHERLYPGSSVYNLSIAFKLYGNLDMEALIKSAKHIVNRHESLRTTFIKAGKEAIQTIHPEDSWNPILKVIETDSDPLELIYNDQKLPFELSQPSQIRVIIYQFTQASYYAVSITMHHIITDFHSFGLYMKELITLYSHYSGLLPTLEALAPLPIQYLDYAAWLNQTLSTEATQARLQQFMQNFSAPLEAAKLPSNYTPTLQSDYTGARQSLTLSYQLAESILTLKKQQKEYTLFMLFLAVYKCLLHSYTGQEDIIVSIPMACRNHPDIDYLIGYFNNIFPIRTHLTANPTFLDIVASIRKYFLESYNYQDIPFQTMMDNRAFKRALPASVIFNFFKSPKSTFEFANLKGELIPDQVTTSNFDLYFYIIDYGDEFTLYATYRTVLLTQEKAQEMLSNYTKLLDFLVSNPTTDLKTLRSVIM